MAIIASIRIRRNYYILLFKFFGQKLRFQVFLIIKLTQLEENQSIKFDIGLVRMGPYIKNYFHCFEKYFR